MAPLSKAAPASNLINPAKKLEDLNAMLKKSLITTDEYNAKKKWNPSEYVNSKS